MLSRDAKVLRGSQWGNQDPPHGSGSGPNMQGFSWFAPAMTHRVPYPLISKFMTER